MAKKESTPPTLDELIHLMSDLAKESDRGYALTLAAWLDDSLCEVIRARFIDHQASADELLIGDSPLATFSARIKIAFCLGLIDERVKRDLNIIRSIRNEFAHQRTNLTFESPSVKSRCASLGLLSEIQDNNKDQPVIPRNSFMLVASHLLMYLIGRTEEVDRPNTEPGQSLNSYFAECRACEPQVQQLVAYAEAQVAASSTTNPTTDDSST